MAVKRLVTRTPQTWLGTIVEAAFGTAGRSIAVGNDWYRFKRGRGVVVSSAEIIKGRTELCVVENGEVSKTEITDLHRLIGKRWSILNNCATAFAPFWRPGMSNVSTGDRQSIVRSVLLGLFVTVALVIGGGWFVNDWIDAKFDSLQRSMSAHFGQVKAMLKEGEQ